MRESFPEVLRHVRRDNVVLRTPPSTASVVPVLNDGTNNLPLLTHLLPERYPHAIDLGIISKSEETDDGPSSRPPFRSYEVESSSVLPEVDTATDVPVRLVQFEGRVGTGNRSIRSDMPFPAIAGGGRCASSDKKRDGLLGGSSCGLIGFLKGMIPLKLKLMNENGERRRGNDVAAATRTMDPPPRVRGIRPFVVPTLIPADEADEGLTMIDLTPRLVAYYEVSIVGRDRDDDATSSRDENDHHPTDHHRDCISIGLSIENFRVVDKMPGWDQSSYGYHSDDGGIFHGTGTSSRRQERPTYGPGDVVGCGLDYVSRRIFFTRNGKFLGYEFDVIDLDVVETGLFPTVGIDSNRPIFVNFGERPFHFDWTSIKV